MTQKFYIRVRGWDKYQHYKDRNPPWIKLHQELLTSLTWTLADDASRVLMVAIMLLASRTENKVPANPDYLKRVAYLHQAPDLSQLVHLEFIEIIDDSGQVVTDASKALASARPETEEETETYKPEKQKPSRAKARAELTDVRYKDFIEDWHKYFEHTNPGSTFKPGEADFAIFKQFLREHPEVDRERFRKCLNHRAKSPISHTKPARYWMLRILEFEQGPLDKFWEPIKQGNGNGHSVNKADQRITDVHESSNRVFESDPAVSGNTANRLQNQNPGRGIAPVAGHTERLLVSGVRPGNAAPDKKPAKV